jgi:hypothetical protein
VPKEFKYFLLPNQIYKVEFEDLRGKPFTVEILGSEIIDQIRRTYVLDKFLEDIVNGEFDKD